MKNILLDEKFQKLSAKERKRILERLLSEIRGRMMEEIVLLETKIAHPNKEVFKLQFAVGEFDMVVFDPEEINCEIYEVKYSKEQVKEQYRHLKDENKCSMTTHRYGNIIGKYVIYRGKKIETDGIQYLNVEEYLKSIKKKTTFILNIFLSNLNIQKVISFLFYIFHLHKINITF